jgi:predicted O-methyltransferase YrrM
LENYHTNIITDLRVQKVLDRLYADVKKEQLQRVMMGVRLLVNRVFRLGWSLEDYVRHTKDLYIPLSRERGTFAYLVARSIKARRIVEFGTAFGISTIYLAAAVRDNGGGIVIGSELDQDKAEMARANLEEAGLADYVEIRQGDAMQTLADPGGPVDLLLNDGYKDYYILIVKLLTPFLRPGAVVLGDNMTTGSPILPPMAAYMEYMKDPRNGFLSITLPLKDGLEYSVRL